MRSEQEMLDLIINTARQDERIRAVMMNGSRANPNARRDFFQDFDIVYFVTELEPFKHNFEWLARFGELMIIQLPDAMEDPPPLGGHHFTYLAQFRDGNRIDLSLFPIDHLAELESDSQTIILLDKDGLFPSPEPPSDRDYLPKPPTAKAYFDCTNEFWWVCPYAAKGLWRQEFTYARQMLDEYVREQLMKMLVWYVGVKTGFSLSPGKSGKYLQRYLEPELWARLLTTYADGSYECTWDALFAMGDLFRITAQRVAEHFGFEYPLGDDQRVTAHLRHVQQLPRDAKEMY
jgi:aminoglycoside 6-adenylyltransferase